MYAVIETGGKQYRVEPGDVIDVELLEGEPEADSEVSFERVLLVANDDKIDVGQPVVEGAQVKATLLSGERGPKVKVFKKKRRKGYKRLNGHRQDHHRVRIESIEA